jgi:O-antigen/teichoic acid export membrane protein
VIFLEYFRATPEVAEYRAVLAVAGLNTLVFEAFAFLYTPVASRMFAREDRQGIGALYWQTAQWIAVLTFPVFIVTCALARPLTVLLFGTQYANAATLLSLMAVGYYVNAALGFNAATLLVHGQVRFVVLGEVIASITAVGLNLLLIPRFGALGAAASTMTSLIVLNAIHNACLWLGGSGVPPFDWRFMRVYMLAVSLTAALLALQWLFAPPFWLGIASAAVVSVLVIRVTRHSLRPDDAFPELLRIPLLRVLVR